MSVVLRRTVWDDIDWRFDNLSGSHLQSQVICVTSVDTIRTPVVDVTSTTGVLIVSTDVTQITWLWRWLPLRLSKRRSMSSQTVLLRTTLTRTIVLYLMKCYFACKESHNFFGLSFVWWWCSLQLLEMEWSTECFKSSFSITRQTQVLYPCFSPLQNIVLYSPTACVASNLTLLLVNAILQ